MKVLHITSWYPSKSSPVDGIFIKEHIESLLLHNVINLIFHIKISKGPISISLIKEHSHTTINLRFPFVKWFVLEILVSFVVLLILIRNYNKYDILNFHIAYPSLIYWKYLKHFTKKPILCNEHWSAYGQNFGMARNQKNNKKLRKIKNIFSEKILFLFVSKHLSKQVLDFANGRINAYEILPNVVNDFFVNTKKTSFNELQFFSAAVWRKGKRPIEIIQGFHNFSRNHPSAKLIIAGNGELTNQMEKCINDLGAKNIFMIGEKTKIEISKYLEESCALCHCSDHETFSVVCAESLVSGRPVLVNKLPAVMEFTNKDNSILVEKIDVQRWEKAFEEYYEVRTNFNRSQIAIEAERKFSKWFVGKKYMEYLLLAYENNH